MNEKDLAKYIGSKIKEYRKLRGLTQKELAQKIKMGDTTIANYEKGFRSPKKDTMFALANAFDISIDDLFPPINSISQDSTTPQEIPSSVSKLNSELNTENHSKWIDYGNELLEEQNTVQEESAEYSSDKVVSIKKKLFKYHVYEKLSAGTGESYFNDWNYDEVYYDEEIDHDFASWIFGDSMEPRFLNGEVALIKDTGFDYDGAIYAVEWDGQTYIKKVKREKDGLRLISLNSKYKDKFAPYDEDPRIIGKIVGSFQPISI
ncbi:helix-turn-helix domain-containing protein [Streptococcus danieliae]|uniref:Helix-turn-helix domain-containing protein n=1 Tax=Streptococcus danieliae TaxID=747656 RepID=A0A7X3G6T8_9STRE|nr:S24 family peptidase [Streptococcus danieliae]MVX58203.1 helix-turn-helix domain-containing protein [Streptococcus danieliae]